MRTAASALLGALFIMSLFGCSGSRPTDIGISAEDRLTPCPSRPNCVSSDAADADHRIEPLRFEGDSTAVWSALNDVVRALPRTEIITTDDRYLYAEATSKLLGFVDDVEFHLRPEEGEIAVRSASRIGRSDWGVNAGRIETIRGELKAKGLLR